MKKKISIIVLSCFLLITIFSFIICSNYNKRLKNNNFKEKIIADKYWMEYVSNNHKLIDGYLKLNSAIQNAQLLHEIVDSTSKLIFRFKETDCSFCIENGLTNLIKLSNKVGTNSIILIGSFSNNRSRWMRKCKFEIYNILNYLKSICSYYPWFLFHRNL